MSRSIAPLFLSVACLAIVAACSAGAEPQDEVGKKTSNQIEVDGLVAIENFTGTVIIRTGPGLKFDAKMVEGALVEAGKIDKPFLKVSSKGIVVEGDDDAQIKQCNSKNDKYRLKLKGDKLRSLDDYPRIEIEMPESAGLDLQLDNGVANIGNVHSSSVQVNGCGDIKFGDVARHFAVEINGSGDVQAGDVGDMAVEIRGSGDIDVDDVHGKAVTSIKGSGDVNIGDVDGEFYASIKGSGDIIAESAHSNAIIDIKGSGDVSVEDGNFESVNLNVTGSGDISLEGSVEDLNVMIKGSGDIDVGKLTGDLTGAVRGSGDLSVAGRTIYYKDGRWVR